MDIGSSSDTGIANIFRVNNFGLPFIQSEATPQASATVNRVSSRTPE